MAEEESEVRIRFTIDDQSSETIEKLKEGMHETNAEIEKGEGHAEGFGAALGKAGLAFGAIAAAAAVAAAGIAVAYELTMKLAEASSEAADEGQKQVNVMSGLHAMMDRGQHSMADIVTYSKGLHEELEKNAIAAGVTSQSMVSMYDTLIKHGAMGTEKAKEMASTLSIVGKTLPGGGEALAQGFSQMELGMVRARNPLVQLISATGTLKGNAQVVAHLMQHMTPAKQMELAEKALQKQADVLKGGAVPATIGGLTESFKGMREMFLESVGDPINAHLVPALEKAKKFLTDHMDTITMWGERIGNFLGDWIDKISAAVEGVYSGISKNWDSLVDSYHQIFDSWTSAWSFSASTTGEIKDQFAEIGKSLVEAFKVAMGIAKATAEVFMKVGDVISGKAIGTTEASIASKAMQAQVLGAVSGEGAKDAGQFQDMARRYKTLALEAGQSEKAIDAWIASNFEAFQKNEQWAQGARNAALSSHDWEQMSQFSENIVGGQTAGVKDAALQVTADLALQSEDVRKAIMAGEIHISSGMDEFIKMLSEKSPELGRKFREMKDIIKEQGGIKPSVQFNNNTFHIHQDFRDQDPDRIAIVFRRDIIKHASALTQARSAYPLGL